MSHPTPGPTQADAVAAAAEAVLSRGHLLRRRVRGFSMAPWIQDGDQVLLAAADPERLRPGDIIQFQTADGLRIHRILAVRRGHDSPCFLVAGDRSDVPDPPVSSDAIRGRAVAVLRGGRAIRLDGRVMRARAPAGLARPPRPPTSGPARSMTAAERACALRSLIRAALCPGGPPPMLSLDAAGWAHVAAAGIRGGVGPLLHAAVLSHPETLACPERVRARLRAAHLVAVSRDALRRHELSRVLLALRAGQVPTLVLKGAALAETAYPDPALRPMHDVDLLVRPADRARARAVLLDLGYEDVSNGPEDFVHAASGLDIDLHTDLINATRLPSRRGAWRVDLEAFWGRAIPGRVAGVPVQFPDPADHFVYAAQHLMLHHGMDGLLRFADLLALGLCLRQTPGWEAMARTAREAEAGLAVFLVFAYLREGFGLDIPHAASSAVAPGWPRAARRALSRLTLDHRLTEDAKFVFAFLTLSSWRERAAYLKDTLMPDPPGPETREQGAGAVWRHRMGHVVRMSHVLWGAARRALQD